MNLYVSEGLLLSDLYHGPRPPKPLAKFSSFKSFRRSSQSMSAEQAAKTIEQSWEQNKM
jgi:hypothetical protein